MFYIFLIKNTRPGNTPVIWGVCLILTCYRNSYSHGVFNRIFCLNYGIKENHILHWHWIIFLHVHMEPFKTSRFLRLFAIIIKYSEKMKPCMHCSHKTFKTVVLLFERWGCCLNLLLLLYIFKWEEQSLLPQKYVWSWDSSLVGGCIGGSCNWNIWRFLPKWSAWPPQLYPLPSWLKIPWLGWIIRPSAVFSSRFHSVWSRISNYCRGLLLLIWGILGDHIGIFGISHLSSETQTTPKFPKFPTTPPSHTSPSGPPHQPTKYEDILYRPPFLTLGLDY